MSCVYKATGEYLCNINIEHFKENNNDIANTNSLKNSVNNPIPTQNNKDNIINKRLQLLNQNKS